MKHNQSHHNTKLFVEVTCKGSKICEKSEFIELAYTNKQGSFGTLLTCFMEVIAHHIYVSEYNI